MASPCSSSPTPHNNALCAIPAAQCSTSNALSVVHAVHGSCVLQVDAIISRVHRGLWWKSLLSAPASMVCVIAFAGNSLASCFQ